MSRRYLGPHFHSNYLASSVTALSKMSTMLTNVFSHEHTELPTSSLLQLVGAPLCCRGKISVQQPVASPLKLGNDTRSNTCAVTSCGLPLYLDFNNYENIASDFIIYENALLSGRWGGGGRRLQG